ncbi:TIGR03084 family metal-binding protein [Actinosynnema sp. NPDC047251]|uniref:Wyosine base formation n=1 Tax=Saccharothrix espanaensis (strain ATCC 51144 / DSM 44229 / JCM 9112 / NBRC 15066 / NRRL 15764) TaxID=1179773 RepID=K0K3V6_SACES|nr:TIGR03084 family metal-binding protein [Saccharothrix espanaensis]CCH31223.1 Wyosine base formation [Saccharothrix espanaensis DSM 44229]
MDVITALRATGDDFDRMVATLDHEQWSLSTPAPGWTVKHQVAHLTSIFGMAGMAAAEGDKFRAVLATLSDDFDANVDASMAPHLALDTGELLRRWQATKDAAIGALAAVPADAVVPWLVNPLTPTVLAAAGMMELFGHGQDVADALGVTREWDDRLGFLVGFAVRTKDFGYLARGERPPADEFRFEITAPSGQRWDHGPEDAAQRVTGSAEDFCLLVTRRRHHADLDVRAEGAVAGRWLELAQAYRGPAGPGRAPTRSPLRAGR